MATKSASVSLRTLDGLRLAGTLTRPAGPVEGAVVMVHGGGVTREEGGFFARLAAGLGEAGVAILRFDLRGHGESEGRQEESTLLAHLNDIAVAIRLLRTRVDVNDMTLLGASFGGGLVAYYAAKRPKELERLVLLNPQLNYKNRYVDQKPWWSGDQLQPEAARSLQERGYLRHSASVKHGRALLNEVFWVQPHLALPEITAPTLIVHGTHDTFVPIDSSRNAVKTFKSTVELVEIEGAQHGFAVHEDPRYLNPQSQEWQAFVIGRVAEWLHGVAEDQTETSTG